MSHFSVKSYKVNSIMSANNSDRLDIIGLDEVAFQVVAQKGTLSVGDNVVYFPVDSILPEWIVECLGLSGRLSKNRVKTVKLRGNTSQGLVCLPEVLMSANPALADIDFSGDLTEALGIVKYEAEPVFTQNGNLLPMPENVSRYDIEGYQNAGNVFGEATLVVITEKVEGTNWWASIDADGNVSVGQRNYAIERDENNMYWKAFLSRDAMRIFMETAIEEMTIKRITFRGELVGEKIQGNYYGINGQELYLFDIEVNGIPVPHNTFEKIVDGLSEYGIKSTPTIFKGGTLSDWLNCTSRNDVIIAADGMSIINPSKRREGIVIKSQMGGYRSMLNRTILKQRSLDYLANTDY